MKYILFIFIIIMLVVIIRTILNAKDKETEKTLNDERKIAYDAAWKVFAPDCNKKKSPLPFDFRRAVDPPILAIHNGSYWYSDDCWDNYIDIYKFINGKWEFYCKKTMRKELFWRVSEFEICEKLNCNLCTEYLHLKKNRQKSLNKASHLGREYFL